MAECLPWTLIIFLNCTLINVYCHFCHVFLNVLALFKHSSELLLMIVWGSFYYQDIIFGQLYFAFLFIYLYNRLAVHMENTLPEIYSIYFNRLIALPKKREGKTKSLNIHENSWDSARVFSHLETSGARGEISGSAGEKRPPPSLWGGCLFSFFLGCMDRPLSYQRFG